MKTGERSITLIREELPAGRQGASKKREIRIAVLTDSNVFAGTERHMLDLARGLQAAGADIRIACPGASPLAKRALKSRMSVFAVEKRGSVDWRAIAILRRKLLDGEIDLIHAHNGRTALASTLAVSMAGRGVCVLTQHFLDPAHSSRRGLKGALSRAAHRFINRRAGHIIAISEAARNLMLERGETLPEKVTVIPNGIPAPEAPRLAPARDVRASLGIAETAPLLVCAARLEPEKDIQSLIAAMPTVIQSCPEAVCIIAGEGSEEQALSRQINALGLAKSVRLIGFHEDALSIIRACDLFVLPSVAEPFGLVLLEAMALNKPVIATRAGGPIEIVKENETGKLVTPRCPGELSAAIAALLRDPAERTRMGAEGFRRYKAHYTVEGMTAATLAVYERAWPRTSR